MSAFWNPELRVMAGMGAQVFMRLLSALVEGDIRIRIRGKDGIRTSVAAVSIP